MIDLREENENALIRCMSDQNSFQMKSMKINCNMKTQ
jgi:hypothetical protein